MVPVMVLATKGEPILVVSTDITLSPEIILQLCTLRFSMELALKDLKRYGGDYQCWTLLAIHRFVHLTLTACGLWRLTLLQDQQAPWLTAVHVTSAGALCPLSLQWFHRALQRVVLQRIFAAATCGADFQKTAPCYEQVFRIAP